VVPTTSSPARARPAPVPVRFGRINEHRVERHRLLDREFRLSPRDQCGAFTASEIRRRVELVTAASQWRRAALVCTHHCVRITEVLMRASLTRPIAPPPHREVTAQIGQRCGRLPWDRPAGAPRRPHLSLGRAAFTGSFAVAIEVSGPGFALTSAIGTRSSVLPAPANP